MNSDENEQIRSPQFPKTEKNLEEATAHDVLELANNLANFSFSHDWTESINFTKRLGSSTEIYKEEHIELEFPVENVDNNIATCPEFGTKIRKDGQTLTQIRHRHHHVYQKHARDTLLHICADFIGGGNVELKTNSIIENENAELRNDEDDIETITNISMSIPAYLLTEDPGRRNGRYSSIESGYGSSRPGSGTVDVEQFGLLPDAFSLRMKSRCTKKPHLFINASKSEPHPDEIATAMRVTRSTPSTPLPSMVDVNRVPCVDGEFIAPVEKSQTKNVNLRRVASDVNQKRNQAFYEMKTNKVRNNIMENCLQAERSYTDNLKDLIEKFKVPLRADEICSEMEIDDLFVNFEKLLEIHTTFYNCLLDEYVRLCEDENHLIGDVFNQMFFQSEFAEAYTEFGMRYGKMRLTYERLKYNNFKFNEFEEVAGSKNFAFLSITPIQRLPRYKLIIKDLIKETPDSHDDLELLLRAERQVSTLAEKVDRTVHEATMEQKRKHVIDLVMNIFEDDFLNSLCDHEKRNLQYIRQDLIIFQDQKRERVEKTLWLLNNIIVISSKKPNKTCKENYPAEYRETFPTLDLTNKHRVNIYFLIQDTKISDSNTQKELRETVYRHQNDIDVFGRIISDLKKLTKSQSEKPEVRSINSLTNDLYDAANQELKNMKEVNHRQLDLIVNTEQGVKTVSIEFLASNKSEFTDHFEQAKIESLGSQRVGPSYMYGVRIITHRYGTKEMFAASQPGTLWVSLCDDTSANICHLAADTKSPCEQYKIMQDSKINFLFHVAIDNETTVDEVPNKAVCDYSSEDESIFDLSSAIASTKKDEGIIYIPDGCIWVGTEDGKILIYQNQEDVKHQQLLTSPINFQQPVHCVFQKKDQVILSVGVSEESSLYIYKRTQFGWNIARPEVKKLETILLKDIKNFNGFGQMAFVQSRNKSQNEIWASSGMTLYILCEDTFELLTTLDAFTNCGSEIDPLRKINYMVTSNGYVWLSQNKRPPIVEMWEAETRESKSLIEIETYVVKQLASCDPILRRHRKQALRVTCLHIAANYLWVGTTAGVILSLELNDGSPNYGPNQQMVIQTLCHGHAGPVRFIASTEISERVSAVDKRRMSTPTSNKFILVSGGDGWEEYSSSENNGEEDAKPYLLLWRFR